MEERIGNTTKWLLLFFCVLTNILFRIPLVVKKDPIEKKLEMLISPTLSHARPPKAPKVELRVPPSTYVPVAAAAPLPPPPVAPPVVKLAPPPPPPPTLVAAPVAVQKKQPVKKKKKT
jgi:hypothetical protein